MCQKPLTGQGRQPMSTNFGTRFLTLTTNKVVAKWNGQYENQIDQIVNYYLVNKSLINDD